MLRKTYVRKNIAQLTYISFIRKKLVKLSWGRNGKEKVEECPTIVVTMVIDLIEESVVCPCNMHVQLMCLLNYEICLFHKYCEFQGTTDT